MTELLSFDQMNISFKDKTFSYGPFTLGRNKERIHLQGASGSGKSVFLRGMMGLEQASFKNFTSEQELSSATTRRKKILYLAQKNIFPAELSAEDYINMAYAFNGKRAQLPIGDGPLKRLEDLFKGESWKGQQLSSFSGGQGQAFRLLLALSLSPYALILDEVFTGLDQKLFEVLSKELENFQGPVLYTSHDKALPGSRALGTDQLLRK